MPVSWPITIPDTRIQRAKFALVYNQSAGADEGGAVDATDFGPPYWTASFETGALDPVALDGWNAFADSLRGGRGTFQGYNPNKTYPRAYMNGTGFTGLTRVGGGSFDGTAVLNAFISGRTQIQIGRSGGFLPNGFVVSAGDFLSIDRGSGKRGLYRTVIGGNADANGRVTLDVEPYLPGDIGVGAALTFFKPWAKMRLANFESSEDANAQPRIGQVSFSAIQDHG